MQNFPHLIPLFLIIDNQQGFIQSAANLKRLWLSPKGKKEMKGENSLLICSLLDLLLQFQIDQISPYNLWSVLTVFNTNQARGLWKECSWPPPFQLTISNFLYSFTSSFKIFSSIKEENRSLLPNAAQLIFPLASEISFFQTVSNTQVLSRLKGKFFLPTGIHSQTSALNSKLFWKSILINFFGQQSIMLCNASFVSKYGMLKSIVCYNVMIPRKGGEAARITIYGKQQLSREKDCAPFTRETSHKQDYSDMNDFKIRDSSFPVFIVFYKTPSSQER